MKHGLSAGNPLKEMDFQEVDGGPGLSLAHCLEAAMIHANHLRRHYASREFEMVSRRLEEAYLWANHAIQTLKNSGVAHNDIRTQMDTVATQMQQRVDQLTHALEKRVAEILDTMQKKVEVETSA